MNPTVTISSRGEQRLRGGHPWIYRTDVGDVNAGAGDIVVVRNPTGRVLGSGALQRSIADRDPHADLRRASRRRVPDCGDGIDAAIAFRASLGIDATAYRLVHGEADLLPSLIVDRYGDYLVVQALSQGDGSAAAAGRRRRSSSCCSRRAFSRATIPRAAAARRARADASRCCAGEVPDVGHRARRRHRVRRRPAARPEDRTVPRPAREPRGRGALCARAACSTASATTAASR